MSKHVEICHHVTEFVGNARKYMILEHEKLCCRVREAGNVTSKFPRGIRKEPSAPYAAVLDGDELSQSVNIFREVSNIHHTMSVRVTAGPY